MALPGKERAVPREYEDEDYEKVASPPRNELEYWKNKSRSLSKSKRQLEKRNEESGEVVGAHEKLVVTHIQGGRYVRQNGRSRYQARREPHDRTRGLVAQVDHRSEDENELPAVIVTPAPRRKIAVQSILSAATPDHLAMKTPARPRRPSCQKRRHLPRAARATTRRSTTTSNRATPSWSTPRRA